VISTSGKSTKTETGGLIALGSNVAAPGLPPEATLAGALAALDDESLRITAISRFYRTPFLPAGTAPDVVNAVAAIRTALDPAALLARLHEVEAAFGRTRTRRWAARRLDLDLLDLGGGVLPDAATQERWRRLAPHLQAGRAPDELILPHPRLQDRAFVLVPLAEIAPGWRHPSLGRTAREMLDALPEAEKAQILPISDPWADLSALVKAFRNQ